MMRLNRNPILLLCLLLFILGSCQRSKKTFKLEGDIKNVTGNELYLFGTQKPFDRIDTIRLDSVVTSYVIETSLRDSVISVLDKYFGMLYRFNLDGSFKEKKLGRGHAKSETSIGHIAILYT